MAILWKEIVLEFLEYHICQHQGSWDYNSDTKTKLANAKQTGPSSGKNKNLRVFWAFTSDLLSPDRFKT